jgi:1,4-dihydroxy-2-naphthoyl-CoA synthase
MGAPAQQADVTMDWTTVPELAFEDVLYQQAEAGIARISINRPEVHNAFRPETVMELQRAFTHAHHDPAIGVIILTGEGGRPSVRAATSACGASRAATRTRAAPST